MGFWSQVETNSRFCIQIHVPVSRFTFLYPDSYVCIQIHVSVSKVILLCSNSPFCIRTECQVTNSCFCIQVHDFVSRLKIHISVSIFTFLSVSRFMLSHKFIFLYPKSLFYIQSPDSCFCIQIHHGPL